MKKKIFWLGVLAITLVLGMTAVSCSDGGGGGIEGKWYSSEYVKEYLGESYYDYDFKSDGTGKAYYGMVSFEWTATKTELTITTSSGSQIIFEYIISGDELTLTLVSGTLSYYFDDGTFYR